jgi:hypothetical protein
MPVGPNVPWIRCDLTRGTATVTDGSVELDRHREALLVSKAALLWRERLPFQPYLEDRSGPTSTPRIGAAFVARPSLGRPLTTRQQR